MPVTLNSKFYHNYFCSNIVHLWIGLEWILETNISLLAIESIDWVRDRFKVFRIDPSQTKRCLYFKGVRERTQIPANDAATWTLT